MFWIELIFLVMLSMLLLIIYNFCLYDEYVINLYFLALDSAVRELALGPELTDSDLIMT